MLHTGVFKVVAQFVVNLVNATFDRTYDASSAYYCRMAEHVEFIAPIYVYPGEDELLTLAENALAAITGSQLSRIAWAR